jgi:hypothetical protein
MNETQVAVNKSAAVSVATFIGVWGGPILTTLSIVYVACQLYFLLRDKVYRPWMKKRNEQRSSND